jgi:hypothetical protein
MAEDPEPLEEEDPPQELTPGHHEVAEMISGDLGEALLLLIGNASQVLALLLETDEEEFGMNARRLQTFFDIVRNMPTQPMRRTPVKLPVGFQVAAKKTLRRKSRKPKKTE